jgi:hypothetical protein
MSDIDWSKHDAYPEDTVECSCGASYRSHVKLKKTDDGIHLFTRKPCPACGHSIAHAARSDPETWTLNAERAQEGTG